MCCTVCRINLCSKMTQKDSNCLDNTELYKGKIFYQVKKKQKYILPVICIAGSHVWREADEYSNIRRLRHETQPSWEKLVNFAKPSTESLESASPPKSSNCKYKTLWIYVILDILELSVFSATARNILWIWLQMKFELVLSLRANGSPRGKLRFHWACGHYGSLGLAQNRGSWWPPRL